MRSKRLLEAIREINSSPDSGRERYNTHNINEELDSVAGYLNKILTTKQGSVEIADDFGMPDYTTLVYESVDNAVDIIASQLSNILEKYEPRLKNITIKFQGKNDNELSLIFSIEAFIIDHINSPVYFKTIFGSDGSISIKES